MKVRPNYPRWFEPVARLAEHRPRGALVAVIITLGLTFTAGIVAGLVLC